MQTAMIWGAGGGIGRALVTHLASDENEWAVIAISRRSEALALLTPYTFEADVGDDFAVQNAVMATSQEVESVDLWIYAAGDIMATPVARTAPQAWQRILTANLTGAYLATRHSLPLLAQDAHLVFLGAISERLRLPSLAAYAAAKAGLEAFAETLRKEERKKRVTVVRPSAVATPLWDKVPMRLPKNAASPEKVAQRIVDAYEEGHQGTLDLA